RVEGDALLDPADRVPERHESLRRRQIVEAPQRAREPLQVPLAGNAVHEGPEGDGSLVGDQGPVAHAVGGSQRRQPRAGHVASEAELRVETLRRVPWAADAGYDPRRRQGDHRALADSEDRRTLDADAGRCAGFPHGTERPALIRLHASMLTTLAAALPPRTAAARRRSGRRRSSP